MRSSDMRGAAHEDPSGSWHPGTHGTRASRARAAGIAALFVAASGCAGVPLATSEEDSAAKAFRIEPRVANVYVYCASELPLGIAYRIFVDGEALADLAGSTFALVRVRPGPHTVSFSTEYVQAQAFLASGGRNYYVNVMPLAASPSTSARLTLVADEERAKQEIGRCRLVERLAPADDRRAPAANAPSPLAWRAFSSTGDGFSVSFPGEPRRGSLQMALPAGDARADMYLVETPQAEYDVAVAPLPPGARGDPGAYLLRAVDAMGRLCRVVGERTFARDPPTIQAELDCGQRGRTRVRVVATGTRRYQIAVLARRGELPADADAFLESFVAHGP